ncbi:uncharacterized protein LOC132608007 [Lycium barbarum]|uniref:uncharacterized protein LOC132608007 n=1 Tax=Lycium barbarum TaxID=112863 RepID=UPI00293E3B06|nr:uncharacterized protein LOC132608007 [Lycium barbarum]
MAQQCKKKKQGKQQWKSRKKNGGKKNENERMEKKEEEEEEKQEEWSEKSKNGAIGEEFSKLKIEENDIRNISYITDYNRSSSSLASSAKHIWEEFKERFDRSNLTRINHIWAEIASLKQGSDSVTTYYSKMKVFWDELDVVGPLPSCKCAESKPYVEHLRSQRLLMFLMGLNESYSNNRNNLLAKGSDVTLNEAYTIVTQEKSQRLSGVVDKNKDSAHREVLTMMAERTQGHKYKKGAGQAAGQSELKSFANSTTADGTGESNSTQQKNGGLFTHSSTMKYSASWMNPLPLNTCLTWQGLFNGKHHRLKFHIDKNKIATVFQLVHFDLWGPYRKLTYDNGQYFVTLVDDFSKSLRQSDQTMAQSFSIPTVLNCLLHMDDMFLTLPSEPIVLDEPM